MSLIRITKIFSFEMGHALHNYDGQCKNIHGHSYKLSVTIIGKPVTDTSNPKLGMVMDFKDLISIVKEPIVNKFDHALVLCDKHELKNSLDSNFNDNRIIYLPFQPTCENLVIHFANIIRSKLQEPLKLHSLRLEETATSYAEWFASDNEN